MGRRWQQRRPGMHRFNRMRTLRYLWEEHSARLGASHYILPETLPEMTDLPSPAAKTPLEEPWSRAEKR